MNGPDEGLITEAIRSCLAEVDLDTVTKKQGKHYVPYNSNGPDES